MIRKLIRNRFIHTYKVCSEVTIQTLNDNISYYGKQHMVGRFAQFANILELHIRRGIKDNNINIRFSFSENICCDSSLEPSQ